MYNCFSELGKKISPTQSTVSCLFSEANLRDILRKKNLTPIKRKTLNKIWHTETIHMKTHWKKKWIAGRHNQRLFNDKGTWVSAGSSRGIICQLEPIYCYQLNNSRLIVWVYASYSQLLLREPQVLSEHLTNTPQKMKLIFVQVFFTRLNSNTYGNVLSWFGCSRLYLLYLDMAVLWTKKGILGYRFPQYLWLKGIINWFLYKYIPARFEYKPMSIKIYFPGDKLSEDNRKHTF